QDAVGRIQARQAPLIAELTEEYADYMDRLSHLSAEQQLVALGFMDTAEAAKATQAAMVAAEVAAGNLSKAVGEELIVQAAQADPVLRAMLESMGLISMGADGTITVNFPEGESVNELLKQTNENLNNLAIAIDLLDGKPDLQITIDAMTKQAEEDLNNIKKQKDDLDGSTAEITIEGDGTSFIRVADGAETRRDEVDGTSATVNIVGDRSGF